MEEVLRWWGEGGIIKKAELVSKYQKSGVRDEVLGGWHEAGNIRRVE